MSTRDLNWLLARFRDDDSDSEGVDDSFSTGSFEEQFPTVFRLGIVGEFIHALVVSGL